MWSADELIVAPGTADGSGARSIVRIAGDGLASLLASFFEPFDAGGHAAGGSPPRVVSTHLGGLLAADWGPRPVEVLHWPGPGGPIGGPLAEVHLPCSAPLVDALIAANPDKAAAVKDKPQAIGWFVGQVMKETGGKANPAAVNEILKAKLGL